MKVRRKEDSTGVCHVLCMDGYQVAYSIPHAPPVHHTIRAKIPDIVSITNTGLRLAAYGLPYLPPHLSQRLPLHPVVELDRLIRPLPVGNCNRFLALKPAELVRTLPSWRRLCNGLQPSLVRH